MKGNATHWKKSTFARLRGLRQQRQIVLATEAKGATGVEHYVLSLSCSLFASVKHALLIED
ncbi:hypothetical protein BCU26_024165 [Vibrio splendidus]|uniref:hypothetical protein n=1 Tax=Vibrio splendidus TaxID=29497 RepID=UPI0039A61BDB